MSQPEWKLLYATDYSALYVDTTGEYDPELTIAQTDDDCDEDDIEATAAYVYRFCLERCYRATETDEETGETTSYLVTVDPTRTDLPHHISQYKPWFHKDLGSIARTVGRTTAELADALCSTDPATLAHAYEDIGSHHGFDNLDAYPEHWTATEFAEFPDRGPRLSTAERAEFTKHYIGCALWCGVLVNKHEESCPCYEASENGDDYDHANCDCEAELASSDDHNDESDLDSDTLAALTETAHNFYAANVTDLRASTLSMEQCGHDLWLTQNRHGAGFWDRGVIGKPASEALSRLTEMAHAEGECSLIRNPDGKITVL